MMTTRLEEWLKLTREDPIDPDLPICDPHHHLWDYPDSLPESIIPTYARQVPHFLLKDLLEDTGRGHNIEQTVFLECRSMYKKDGQQELRPVGETEFV
jgi:predicted TIM-barrel fold metal-dependent hydrolase